MSTLWEDVNQEQADEELYGDYGHQWFEDHREQIDAEAINDFTTERLRSYYLSHPTIPSGALKMIHEMELLAEKHPVAALLFAVSVAEITVKHLLVRPMLSGLVHNEAVADVVISLAPREVGSDAFKKLLFGILNKVAEVDLTTYKRADSSQTLWEELKDLRAERNGLIHDGISPSQKSLQLSGLVALEFLNVVFPKVLKKLGLGITGYCHIHRLSEEMGDIEQTTCD